MGTYISLTAIQPPFDIGIDAANRQMFSQNFIARTAGDPAFLLEDMVSLLTLAGLGSFGISLFIGGQGLTFPSNPDGTAGDGPYIQLIRTGGAGTGITHEGGRYPTLTFQVITRGISYLVTEAQANAAFLTLDGRYEITV